MAAMRRILLLGANGQVGFELRRSLAPLGDLHCAMRGGSLHVDLAEPDSILAALNAMRPGLVVNAAAWTAVDRAEAEPELAQRINGDALATLGAWAAENAAAVVHYSTDYVFAGDGTRPWREDDPPAPLGVYGRSKLAGETALAASGCRHLVLRTAWVYAARGQNFLRTMLRLACSRDELRVVADQVGSPTPAAGIAAATALVLARWLELDAPRQAALAGVYHLASAGACSWHEFAGAILAGARARGLLSRAVSVVPIGSAEYPTPARRPAWSVLDSSRIAETFGVRLPGWQAGLELVLDELREQARALEDLPPC